jgi:hypothetical protein
MAARASDSHPPGQLDDSRGSMPGSILPDPPATVKGKPAMSQNLQPPSSGERPSISSTVKQKLGMGQNLRAIQIST